MLVREYVEVVIDWNYFPRWMRKKRRDGGWSGRVRVG
jgi:hypothetical protein